MATVTFIFEGSHYLVQCNANDRMRAIISNFLGKIGKDENSGLIYQYNGSTIDHPEKTFSE